MIDGKAIIDYVTDRVDELSSRGIKPQILFLGSYSYFLLKDYYQREGLKTTDRFYELYEIKINGFVLNVCINRVTLLGGQHKPENNTVQVYGS